MDKNSKVFLVENGCDFTKYDSKSEVEEAFSDGDHSEGDDVYEVTVNRKYSTESKTVLEEETCF